MQTEFVSDIIVFLYQTWAKLGKKAMSLSLMSLWIYSLSPLCWAVLVTLQIRGILALTSLVFGPKHSKNVLKKYKWEVFSLEGSVWGRPQLVPSPGAGAGDTAQRASSDGQGDWAASSPGSSTARTTLSPARLRSCGSQPGSISEDTWSANRRTHRRARRVFLLEIHPSILEETLS